MLLVDAEITIWVLRQEIPRSTLDVCLFVHDPISSRHGLDILGDGHDDALEIATCEHHWLLLDIDVGEAGTGQRRSHGLRVGPLVQNQQLFHQVGGRQLLECQRTC